MERAWLRIALALAIAALLSVALKLPQAQSRTLEPACRNPVYSHDFGFKDLLKIIDSNPAIRRIQDLIPCLPKSYRENYVLMYDSKSRQGSSFLFPRVISFGGTISRLIRPSGSSLLDMKRYEPTGAFNDYLILSYQGTYFKGIEDDMEFIDVDPVTREFTFRTLEFHDDRKALPPGAPSEYGSERLPIEFSNDRYRYSKANPEICLECHQSPPRPNWTAYPRWPGAFGSGIYSRSEIDGFKKFMTQSKSKGRYEHLVDNPGGTHYLVQPNGDYYVTETNNHNLNIFIEYFNRQRVAKIIRASKDFARFKYAIYAAAIGCSPITRFIPKNVQENEFQNNYNHYLTDTGLSFQTAGRFSNYDRELASMVAFRYLFEGRGLRMQDWLMQRNRNKYELASFGRGLGQSLALGFLEIQDPEFKLYAPLDSEVPTATCQLLQEKSLSILNAK